MRACGSVRPAPVRSPSATTPPSAWPPTQSSSNESELHSCDVSSSCVPPRRGGGFLVLDGPRCAPRKNGSAHGLVVERSVVCPAQRVAHPAVWLGKFEVDP